MPGPARPFPPGQSANPGGRARDTDETREAKALARAATPGAVRRLIEITGSDDEKAAISACNAILDRGLGKPVQEITGEDGDPIRVEVTGDDARAELARALAGLAARLAPG